MSASKFFRNFLGFTQMGAKEISCHPAREKEHRNDDPKLQKTPDTCMTASANTDLDFSEGQKTDSANSKDVKFSHHSSILFAAKEQESLKLRAKRKHCSGDGESCMILASTAGHLSQPTETDKSQHKKKRRNVVPSTVDVKSSTARRPPKRTQDASVKIRHETVAVSNDDCSSLASSNTEIYGKAECQDFEICEEGNQERVCSDGTKNLAASAQSDSSFKVTQWLCDSSKSAKIQVLPPQTVGTKEARKSKSKQSTCMKKPLIRGHKTTTSSVGEVKPATISQLSVALCNTATKEKIPSKGTTVDRPIMIPGGDKHSMHLAGSQCAVKTVSNITSLFPEKLATSKDGLIQSVPNGKSSASLNSLSVPNQRVGRCVSQLHEHHFKKILCPDKGATDGGQLLRDHGFDAAKSKLNIPLKLANSLDEAKLNHSGSKRREKTTEEVQNNGNALLKQLSHNAGPFENRDPPLQLEDSQGQAKITLDTSSPNSLAKPIDGSSLSCSNSTFLRSSDQIKNKLVPESKVTILGNSQISNSTKTNSKQTQGKGYTLKSVNVRRISFSAGIVYEDEVSSPESSQCSAKTQSLLSSGHSDAAKEVSSSSSRDAFNNRGKPPSPYSKLESTVSSKVPPGSTSVTHRGLCYTMDTEKPFACGFCGKAYTVKKAVYTHIRAQHDEKRYSCEFCGKSYSQLRDLEQHVTVHTQEKPFTCELCGMRFRLQGGLRRHKLKHTEERPFSCKICKTSFKCSADLLRHRRRHDREGGRQGFMCDICKKLLSSRPILRDHMRIHSGERPFNCTLCEKRFRQYSRLQRHMYTHKGTGMPKKTCSVCGKAVSDTYLQVHMRTHTGEKPFECNICGKKFPKKQNLEGHMRSHTGEKPFACSKCGKRFALYSNMVTHKAKCTELSE